MHHDDWHDDPEFGANASGSASEFHRHRVEAARAAQQRSERERQFLDQNPRFAASGLTQQQQQQQQQGEYVDEYDDPAPPPDDDEEHFDGDERSGEETPRDEKHRQPLFYSHHPPSKPAPQLHRLTTATEQQPHQQQPPARPVAPTHDSGGRVATVDVGVGTDMQLASRDNAGGSQQQLVQRVGDLEAQVQALLQREAHLEAVLDREQRTHDAQVSALVREMTARQQELEAEIEELRSISGAGGGQQPRPRRPSVSSSAVTPARINAPHRRAPQHDDVQSGDDVEGDDRAGHAILRHQQEQQAQQQQQRPQPPSALEHEMRREIEELSSKLRRSESERASLEDRAERMQQQLHRVRDDSDHQIEQLRERLLALEERSVRRDNNSNNGGGGGSGNSGGNNARRSGGAASGESRADSDGSGYVSWDDLRALSHALTAAQQHNGNNNNNNGGGMNSGMANVRGPIPVFGGGAGDVASNNSSGNYYNRQDSAAAPARQHQQQPLTQPPPPPPPAPLQPAHFLNNAPSSSFGFAGNGNGSSGTAGGNTVNGDAPSRRANSVGASRASGDGEHPLGSSLLQVPPPPPERSARRTSRTYQHHQQHRHAEGGDAMQARRQPYGVDTVSPPRTHSSEPAPYQQQDDYMAGGSGGNAAILRKGLPTPPGGTVATRSPQRRSSPLHGHMMSSNTVSNHLQWMDDAPSHAQVGVSVSAFSKARRSGRGGGGAAGGGPQQQQHTPAASDRYQTTSAAAAASALAPSTSYAPPSHAHSQQRHRGADLYNQDHFQQQQPQPAQQQQQQAQYPPANFKTADDMLSAAQKVRVVEGLERELMEISLERDRTNDQFSHLENARLRTQADISRKNALRAKLDDLNHRIGSIRVELRSLSALHR